MGITAVTYRTVCATSTGDQDITVASLNGLTPAAARFIAVRATVDGTPADNFGISYGAATAVAKQWVVCNSSEHGVGTTNTYRQAATNECVMLLNPTDGSIDGEATFKEFSANTVTITWGNAPASAYFLMVDLFAGTELQAQADTFTLGNEDVETNVNTVEFEPCMLLTCAHGLTFDDTSYSSAYFSAGVVLNDYPTYTQKSFDYLCGDAQGTTAVYNILNSNRGVGQSWSWKGEFGDFDADGFSCWPRDDDGGGDEVGFLALEFGGFVSCWAAGIDSPTANGDAYWTPSFKSQWVGMGLTHLTAVDTRSSTGDAGSFGLDAFDGNAENCQSVQEEDGEGTMDNQSLSDNTAIELPNDDGSTGWTASFKKFDLTRFWLNFTNSEGTACKWWAAAIEAPPREVSMKYRIAYKSLED